MSNACPDVDFEQAAIKTETAIELGEARVRFACEPSAPKSFVRLVAHDFATRITGRIVPQRLPGRQKYFELTRSCLDGTA